jgi:hypothetical protein
MISTAPVQATQDLSVLGDKVSAFIAIAQLKARNGLTLSEFGELVVALLRVVMSTVDSLPAEGSEKKQWALDAVASLFDALADGCIPILAWPVWILVKPAARSILLLVISGAIESLLPLVRIAT